MSLTECVLKVSNYRINIHVNCQNLVCHSFKQGEEVSNTGTWNTLDAPLDKINLHVRGGTIIPWQEPSTTTYTSRQNPMGLIVVFDEKYLAHGKLFWDDGESLGELWFLPLIFDDLFPMLFK